MNKQDDANRRNEIKKQLGVSPGAARNRLVQSLLFKLVQETDRDICYRCGKRIENEKQLSIEHKKVWFGESDAIQLYFDLDNITFSHLSCNISSSRKGTSVRSKTGFKGVYYHPKRKSPKKWRAQRNGINGTVNIGWYETAEDAAKAYDESINMLGKPNLFTNKDLGLI